MNKIFKLKSENTLWIIITIISLLCAVVLLFFIFQERTKRFATEQNLSETKKAKRSVEIKLDHAQLEIIQFKDKTRLLEREMEQERRDYQAVLEEIEKKDIQITELEGSLTNEKKQRTNLANTLAQLRENYDRLEESLRETKQKANELKSRLSKLAGKAGVELRKIVVKPKKELSGKVLVVNREFHFVVIDLGRRDGVGVGDEFIVYHASERVGRVQVEKVYDTMSTAPILSGSQEQEIIEDSVVKFF